MEYFEIVNDKQPRDSLRPSFGPPSEVYDACLVCDHISVPCVFTLSVVRKTRSGSESDSTSEGSVDQRKRRNERHCRPHSSTCPLQMAETYYSRYSIVQVFSDVNEFYIDRNLSSVWNESGPTKPLFFGMSLLEGYFKWLPHYRKRYGPRVFKRAKLRFLVLYLPDSADIILSPPRGDPPER